MQKSKIKMTIQNPKLPKKLKNYFLQPRHGFTLIEILIASSIFAVIAIFAIATFSLNIKGQKQEKISGGITQSGQFILDNISREVRLAKEISGINPDSFTDGFTIKSKKDGVDETRRYYKEGTNLVLEINGQKQNLLPSSLELGSIQFRGISTALAGVQTRQPYVEIEIVIQNKDYALKPETERTRQVFRTSVVLRNFNTK